MKWEIWVSHDGSEICLIPQDHPQHEQLTHDTDGVKKTRCEVFEADDHKKAKVHYNGWLETYDCR